MVVLVHSRALIDALALEIGVLEIPQDDTGGWHLSVGGSDDAYLYSQDDERLLIVIPIAPLPPELSFPVVLQLFRENLFDSEFAPFQIAADEEGMLVQWAFIPITAVDATALARFIDNLALRATTIRTMLSNGG